MCDAIEHQHRWQRQVCIAITEHLAVAARQQVGSLVGTLSVNIHWSTRWLIT
jgi:hypothetical protein